MKLAAVIAVLALCAVAVMVWRSSSPDGQEGDAGVRATFSQAAGLDRAMAAVQELGETYRCARLPPGLHEDAPGPHEDPPGPHEDAPGSHEDAPGSHEDAPGSHEDAPGERRAGRFMLRERGARLELDRVAAGSSRAAARDGALTLGVVADGRGHARPRHVDAVRRAFEAGDVDVVVSLGGLGTTQAEIAAVLEGLAGPWPLIAIPGDWEARSAHRAAVAALAGRGVVDGARVRLIDAGAVALATFPGAPHVERAMAGVDGCVHSEADAQALTQALDALPGSPPRPDATTASQEPRVRVVLSHVPPRQRGPGATDQVAEGIHIGEPALAEALAGSGAELVIHGLVVAGLASGTRELGRDGRGGLVVLSAGALDGIAEVAHRGELPPLARIVTVAPGRTGPGRVRWQSVAAPGPPKTRPARLE